MRKTIKKILSKATVAVLTLATVLSPMAPTMEVNAAAPTTEATLSDFTYNVTDSVMMVTAYNGNETDIIISGDKLLDEYGALDTATSTPASKVRVLGSTFTMANVKLIELEVDIEGAPTSGNKVQELTFGSNCKLVDAGGMTIPISKSNLFGSWTELNSIDFGELIKANANSLECSLTNTFEGLESLEIVTIDLTSNDTRLKFNSTFANCPALVKVLITNANISDILHMTGYDSEGSYSTDANFTFNNCTFTDGSLDAYSSAFMYFNGDIVLNDCIGSSDNNDVFSLQKFVKGPSTASGDLQIDLGDSRVQVVDNLITSGKWNSISVNKPSTPVTTKLNVIFGDTVTATACSVTNVDTTALTELDAPFYGLDLGSADAEKTFVDNTLASVDFSRIKTVNTLGHTSHNNYTDLSNIDLSQQADAVYYETSSDVLLNQYFVPNSFTTAKSFGGTYYIPFTAWKTEADGSMSEIAEAAIEDIPLANKDSVNIDGHKYTVGMLANATEYTPAQATVIFTDVETGDTRTSYCVDGTVITSVVGYDEEVDYFTDEGLTQPLDLNTTTVAGETLNLYYSSAGGAGSLPEAPSTIDKELTINFANCEVTDIPESVTINWTATVNETVKETGSADRDLSADLTQTIPVTVPTKVDDLNVVSYDFTIANITGFAITKDGTTFTLTYSPAPLEPIVENIPDGASISFGKDITAITATLADGSTKPLGSDNTSLIVNVTPKDLTVYQSPANQTFDNILFYDVTLVITDGTNEWNVKSIDSPMGIAVPIPSDCGSTSGVKVWHYDNGIMTAPTEVENKSVTSNHIVIPTSSYSYYAVSYSLGTNENKTITIKWDDEGHETERPTSVVADWTATYADDSTETGNTVFNRDLTVDTQTSTIAVPRTKNGSALVSTVANIRAVTGYEVVTTAGDPLTFTMKYVGNSPSVVTVTFGTELLDTPTGVTLPTSVPLTVYTWYVDGTKDTYETSIPVGTDGTGTLVVERPMVNEDGSTYHRTTWNWGAVSNYTLTNETAYSVYKYTGTGTGTGIQTVYPVVVKFLNDSTNKTNRPANITVTWTATTASGIATTGTANIPITTTTDSFSQNVTIPDTTGEQRTVTFTGPVINGYSMNVNGSTITYTSNVVSNTNVTYEIIFDDDNNKSGRRPSELTVTLADTTNSANTITSKLTIAENTTTTVKSYKSTITIPTGTTYAITKVETLPDGYKSSISGLSATLKYTPEKVNKTYKIEWKNDVEDVRPSSVTVKVKTGDLEGASLTLNKDTNWAATTELLKYVKGVEANWVAEASNVTNYNATVDGTTITMTYTGTLTEAQKEAINATDKDGSEETKEELYNFEKFDWIDYANRYPDLKKAFGYNKEALYAHYIHYGIAEGRIATWTGKYENVNEDILRAYFPNDYKYRVENSTSADEMLDEIGEGTSTNKNNNSGSSNVTVDENGNTIIKTDNGDGTTTETIVDADGNVVQTKTYATGDTRMDSMIGVYVAIIIVALLLGVICLRDFIITDKNKKLIDSNISM